MTDKLKQTIKDEVGKLPKEAQEAINSSHWETILEEIGPRYSFNEKEITDLQIETLLVLTGLEDMGNYVRNIENEVGTSKDEAEKIAKEVSEKVFTPIYDALSESIKNEMRGKIPNWQQSIDFILSGGNYAVFMESPAGKGQ